MAILITGVDAFFHKLLRMMHFIQLNFDDIVLLHIIIPVVLL